MERLHRHEHQREPATQREVTGVGDHRLDGQPRAAVLQGLQQLGFGVEGDDAHAAGGEIEADATGAGADVEDGAARLAGQRSPQRQVLLVGAALEVVPECLEPHTETLTGNVAIQIRLPRNSV